MLASERVVHMAKITIPIVVTIRWAWSFFTRGRSTRLITGRPLLPPIEEPEEPATERRADSVRT